MSELLTVQEVAELTRLHEMTIRRYIRAGKLEAIRIGRRIRIPAEAVAKLASPASPGDAEPEMMLREPAVAYSAPPQALPPVSVDALSAQLARLSQDDLDRVAGWVRQLNEVQEERLRREKAERKALARKIVEESKRQAGLLAGVPREQIAAEFHALVEQIRNEAIAKGQAIDGEWLGD